MAPLWRLVDRFARWLDRRRVAVLVASVAVTALGVWVARGITLQSDLTDLLPASQRSVKDLKSIAARARPFGTVKVVVEADDPAKRAQVAGVLAERIAKLDKDLVTQVSLDDGPLHRYAWTNRFLFAELDDLAAARDALRERIHRGKLAANPLYIALDDDAPAHDRVDDLRAKVDAARAKAEAPPPWVSKDGRLQQITVQAPFSASNAAKSRALIRAIDAIADDVRTAGVTVQLAGNVALNLHEHDSVLEGMAASGLVTVALCALALLLYYRTGRVVLAMLWALAIGVAATFAMAWLVVGHLNVMTAFLFAIIVGNGINAGLVLVARYLEQVRDGDEPVAAVPRAVAGALRGTFAASATAAIAYASLLVTDFRGFREFGLIAGMGMALTWLATFTVLPALLYVLARRGWIVAGRPPALGRALARLLPQRRLVSTLVVGGLVTAAAVAISVRFLAHDPFLRDWRDLQSTTPDITRVRELESRLKKELEVSTSLAAQAYQVVIAVERRDQVAPLVAKLRATGGDWILDVRGFDDVLPARQADKLAVLADIRALIDDPALSDADRARLADLRPPDGLHAVGEHDVPPELAWPFTERDGSIGLLVVLRGARRFDAFNVDHRLEFADRVRGLELPPGALVAGESLVIAEIIETMQADAPVMTAFALIGSILAVFLILGIRRHGLVTVACGLAGVVVMIATCALAGLRVHFIDLIALPITIGIGIDYVVNLAARDLEEGDRGIAHVASTTGGVVALCSFTTTVGYATLLLSANGGIRAFGLAALIGEVSCIAMALVVGPAWLAALRRRRVTKSGEAVAPP